MRCWGRKQRTASPHCPSPAQTWGGAEPQPCPKGPRCPAGRDSGTQGCCCSSTGALAGSKGEGQAPGGGQDQAPGAERRCPTKSNLCWGSPCCAARPRPGACGEGELCLVQQRRQQHQRALSHPQRTSSTTAEAEQLGKEDQNGVFQQCCFRYYFLPPQLKLPDELTELLKIKIPSPLCPCAQYAATKEQLIRGGDFFCWFWSWQAINALAQCWAPAEILVQKYHRAVVTFSACILPFLSIPQLLRYPPGSGHCPGLRSDVGAWAGKEGQQGWDGGSKTGWCSERWDYINSGVNEKPKPSMRYGHCSARSSHYQSLYLRGQTKQGETRKDIEWTWEVQMIQLKGWFGAVPQLNGLGCDMPGTWEHATAYFEMFNTFLGFCAGFMCYVTNLLLN